MHEIMSATYSTAETAAALEHGNFGVFRRNYNASKLDLLPRFSDVGRGQYYYHNIAEMAVHIALTATHTRETARMVTWGILDTLRSCAIPSGTELTEPLKLAFSRFDKLEKGAAYHPKDLSILATAPEVIFSENIVSRDPDNRTWAIYHCQGDGACARVRIVQDSSKTPMTLRQVRNIAFELAAEFAEDDRIARLLGRAAVYPYLLDLTSVFNDFEKILRFRLNARQAGFRK